MSVELHLELLLGRPVIALNGRRIGRIEEVRAGEHERITEFLAGNRALLERVAALGIFPFKSGKSFRIRWDQLDWSNPEKPRLTCRIEDLTLL